MDSFGGLTVLSGTVKIEHSDLVFEIHGIDEIPSVKRSISVPLERVLAVSTERVSWAPYTQRKDRALLPGVVKDGRFLTSEGTMFFEMRDPDKCVTVTLDHEKHKQIVFEVEDKDATAKMINDAINAQRNALSPLTTP